MAVIQERVDKDVAAFLLWQRFAVALAVNYFTL